MTSIAQKFAPKQPEGNRKALLSKYILEKNQQVERIFQEEEQLAQTNAFAPRNISTNKIPANLVALEETRAHIERANNLEHARNNLAQSELIRDISEIAHFSADIKVQQEKQHEDIKALQEGLLKCATDVQMFAERSLDAAKTLGIRHQNFLGQLDGVSDKLNSLVNVFNTVVETQASIMAKLNQTELEKEVILPKSSSEMENFLGTDDILPLSIPLDTVALEKQAEEVPKAVITSPSLFHQDTADETQDTSGEEFEKE